MPTTEGQPRPSGQGKHMLGTAKRLFAKYKYGDVILANDLDRVIAQSTRQPPENFYERMMWRNRYRYRLNTLGVNMDLVESQMPRKCKYGWQLDPVEATDTTGASVNAYELRKVEDSLLWYDQLRYTKRYVMASAERTTALSAFLEPGDPRHAIVRDVARLATAVTTAYVTTERTRQRLLGAE